MRESGRHHVSKSSVPANQSPPEPSGPKYSARLALSCERGHAPGVVLHALQELRSVVDDRLREELGGRYDRHSAGSAGAARPPTPTPSGRLGWPPARSSSCTLTAPPRWTSR